MRRMIWGQKATAAGAAALLMALLLLGSTGPASAAVVGLVRSKTGSVEVKAPAAEGWSPLRISQPVSPGDKIRCGAGSSVVVLLFQTRKMLSVGANSTATVSANSVTGPSVTAAGSVQGPTTRAMATVGGLIGGYRTDTSRGGGLTPVRISPDNPGWVTSTRPQLRFVNDNTKTGEAKSWTLTLYDQSDNVVWSSHTSTTDNGAVVFDYPTSADIRPLREAKPRSASETNFQADVPPAVYLWQVTPFGATGLPLDGGASWGFITVLSPQDAEQLQTQARTLFGDVGQLEDLKERANQLRLDPTRADELKTVKAQADALQQKAMQDPDSYATSLMLLAQLYEGYGVLQRAEEITAELQPLLGSEATADALQAVYQTASPYARVRAGLEIPARTEPAK